jgi:hypothetical protein
MHGIKGNSNGKRGQFLLVDFGRPRGSWAIEKTNHVVLEDCWGSVYRLDLPPNTFNLSTQGPECFTGYHELYVQTVILSILIMQVNNHCSKIKNIN